MRLVLAAVAVSGFVSFSYEVLWTRLLTFRLGTTVHAFSIMLTTFLLGIGLGGALVGALQRRRAKPNYWRLYGYLEAGVGLTGMATVLLLFAPRIGYESFAGRTLSDLAVSGLIMLVPTTLMGAAFPVACHLYARGVRETGRAVGRIYVFNTVGAVCGAMLTGFFLVHALGTQTTLAAASLLMLAAGGVILAVAPAGRALRGPLPAAGVWGVGVLLWLLIPSDLAAEFFLRNQSFYRASGGEASLLGYAEGVETVIVVSENAAGHRLIASGPVEVAGTQFTLRNTQKLQAHIPMLIHPDPRHVCQIGFGSGETAHLFRSYGIERLDAVEISRAMLGMAARFFGDINGGIVGKAGFEPIVMDGSVYLKYTDREYDVIANDSIWPHMAGNSSLYTLEYFRNGRAHLKEGGIMTSWLPLEMPRQDLECALATFHEVFPYVYVWSTLTHRSKHALIAGSDGPLRVDAARFLERFERHARRDLEVVLLDDPFAFLGCLVAVIGPDDRLPDAPLNTTDLPVLQYLGSRPVEFSPLRDVEEVRSAMQLVARYPASRRDLLANVEALEDADAFVRKLEAMRRASTHVVRGMAREGTDPETAAAEFRRAEGLAPDHPTVAAMRQAREALLAVTPAQMQQMQVRRLAAVADMLMQAGRYQKALIALNVWAQREPYSAVPLIETGRLYIQAGRPDLAVPALRQAVEMEPDSADAHFNLGSAYLAAGQAPAAVAALEQALELEPDAPDTMERLGVACAVIGRASRARELLQRAVELAPELARARHSLAVFLCNARLFAEAIPHLQKLAELRPRSAEAQGLLAEAYAEVGNEQKAAEHRQRADALADGGDSPKD
jgi:spermidine synthase